MCECDRMKKYLELALVGCFQRRLACETPNRENLSLRGSVEEGWTRWFRIYFNPSRSEKHHGSTPWWRSTRQGFLSWQPGKQRMRARGIVGITCKGPSPLWPSFFLAKAFPPKGSQAFQMVPHPPSWGPRVQNTSRWGVFRFKL